MLKKTKKVIIIEKQNPELLSSPSDTNDLVMGCKELNDLKMINGIEQQREICTELHFDLIVIAAQDMEKNNADDVNEYPDENNAEINLNEKNHLRMFKYRDYAPGTDKSSIKIKKMFNKCVMVLINNLYTMSQSNHESYYLIMGEYHSSLIQCIKILFTKKEIEWNEIYHITSLYINEMNQTEKTTEINKKKLLINLIETECVKSFYNFTQSITNQRLKCIILMIIHSLKLRQIGFLINLTIGKIKKELINELKELEKSDLNNDLLYQYVCVTICTMQMFCDKILKTFADSFRLTGTDPSFKIMSKIITESFNDKLNRGIIKRRFIIFNNSFSE